MVVPSTRTYATEGRRPERERPRGVSERLGARSSLLSRREALFGGRAVPEAEQRAQQLRDGECARDEGHDAGHRPEQDGRRSRDRARDRGGDAPRPCNRGSSCRV